MYHYHKSLGWPAFMIQGKREADNELEQQVSSKKQKRDEVTENRKNKANVQNKKESNSNGSFSDSEEDEKLAAKAPVSTSETLSTQAQKGKPAGSPCSSGSSDDGSGVNDPKVALAAGKNGPSATKKKAESNSEPECSSSDKDVTTSSKKLLAASAAVNIIPAKKVETSDVPSSDSGSDEDDVQKTHLTPSSEKLPASVVAQKEKSEHTDNSYDESSPNEDNGSEESKEAPHKNVKDEEMVDAASTEETKKEAPKMAATMKEQNASSKRIFVGNLPYRVAKADLENLFKDCGEIVRLSFAIERDGRFKGFGHLEFATEEAAQKALKLNGSELYRRFIRIEIAREKGTYNPISRNESLKGFCTSLGDECKSSATPKEQNATSKTLFVGNLSFSVEKTDMENLFKDCGEIVDIRFATDREGRFKGFGHVEFATEEAAQNGLKLDGYELLRRSIRLDLAPEKTANSSNTSNRNDSSQTVGGSHTQTVFVKGFDTSLAEDKIKTSLKEHFSSCGMISGISIARDYTGAATGFAWVDFKDVDGFNKALELDGTKVGGYTLLVEARKPRRYNQGGRDGGGQFGGWRGGDRWGQERGGRDGGGQFGGWRGGDQWGQERGGRDGSGQFGGWRGGDQGGQERGGRDGGGQFGGWRGGDRWGQERGGRDGGGQFSGWRGGDKWGQERGGCGWGR